MIGYGGLGSLILFNKTIIVTKVFIIFNSVKKSQKNNL